MSNVFTLESFQEELEAEYEPFVFRAGGQEFVLVSLLRVSKETRKACTDKLKELDVKDGADVSAEDLDEDASIEAIQFILSSVTQDRKGKALIKAIGNDLLMNMKIMQRWQEKTQPGEAQDSPS